jgi:outer membrane protein assembly factor BamD
MRSLGSIGGRLALSLGLVGATVTPVVLSGCAGPTAEDGGDQGPGDYAESAQDNYETGMQALADSDFDTAARYFRYVKAKFPFSKFAVLSDLRMADAEFLHEDYISAIDAYQQFKKFHPTQEYVQNGYCDYKIGEGYFKQIPDDWWLVPPSYEKDMAAALDADRELEAFLDQYPESQYVANARDLLGQVQELLAHHEWYVANFYEKRGQYRGVAFRLQTLLVRYPGSSFAPAADLKLGQAYLQLGEPWNARTAFQDLIDNHSTDPDVPQAKDYLAQLDAQFGKGGPQPPASQALPPLQPSSRPAQEEQALPEESPPEQ